MDTLYNIAEALGVSLNDIFSNKDSLGQDIYDIKSNIYKKIANLCKSKGIDIQTMCDEIDLPYAIYKNYENLKSGRVSLEIIRDISRFFNVTLDYLMDDNIRDDFDDEITDPNYGKELENKDYSKSFKDIDISNAKVISDEELQERMKGVDLNNLTMYEVDNHGEFKNTLTLEERKEVLKDVIDTLDEETIKNVNLVIELEQFKRSKNN